MSQIKTEHRGYDIFYSENGDEWTCFDMGDGKTRSNTSLAKVKAAIDAMLLSQRKAEAVPCLEISSHSGLRAYEAKVTEYVKPSAGARWDRDNEGKVVDHVVASMSERDGSKASRREAKLSELAPDTPDVRAAVQRARDAYGAVKAAEKSFRDAVDAIPRLKLEDIAALVRLSGVDPTGGKA